MTPAFNSAAYIDDTIASIVSQTGRFWVRYHVQDGGSNDGTLAKVVKWQKRLHRGFPVGCSGVELSFDSSADSSMYEAVNKGFTMLGEIDGAYMSWLNSDDRLMPGALDLVAYLFETFPDSNILTGRPCEMDERGHITRVHDVQVYPDRTLAAGLHDGRHLPFVMQEGTFWRTSVWREVGGLDPSMKIAGDFDLWRRMSTNASIVSVDTVLASHRRRPGQLSENTETYYGEVDRSIATKRVDRDEEWLAFQSWRTPSTATRNSSSYSGCLIGYSSESHAWYRESRSLPTAPGGSLHLEGGRMVPGVPGRFTSGFDSEGHAYAHLNLAKGSVLARDAAEIRFPQLPAGRYRLSLRCRNFIEGLNVEVRYGNGSLLSIQLPVTNHDRDCLLYADVSFTDPELPLAIQMNSPDVQQLFLLVLACELIPGTVEQVHTASGSNK